MKTKDLKLYNEYLVLNPNPFYFYKQPAYFIGISNKKQYCFLYIIKNKNRQALFYNLSLRGFDPNKIVKELNLQEFVGINNLDYQTIFEHKLFEHSEDFVKKYIFLDLKDKLNNIINR